MSLEQTLEKLVTAIENYTAELVKNREAFTARATTAAAVIEKAKTETVKVDAAKKPAAAQSAAGAEAPESPATLTGGTPNTTAASAGSDGADAALEYSTLADAILALVAKDKPKAVAILAEFGVKKGPELKPEQWQDCYDKVQAALEPADSLA